MDRSSASTITDTTYVPRPSKGIKFQLSGLFLLGKKAKFHTLGGFQVHNCIYHDIPGITHMHYVIMYVQISCSRHPMDLTTSSLSIQVAA